MTRRWLAVWLVLLVPAAARGHVGPPFPLLMNEQAGPYKVSVWTDPDVGVGAFFVFVEALDGGAMEEVEVSLIVRPTSGRLREATYPAVRQVIGRQLRYYAEVEFDRQEFWKVRVAMNGPAGKSEVEAEVEATPPGLGRWDFLLYLFPFLLLAGLWTYGVIRYRHRQGMAKPYGATAGDASKPAR